MPFWVTLGALDWKWVMLRTNHTEYTEGPVHDKDRLKIVFGRCGKPRSLTRRLEATRGCPGPWIGRSRFASASKVKSLFQ